jgi:hypothetical protein
MGSWGARILDFSPIAALQLCFGKTIPTSLADRLPWTSQSDPSVDLAKQRIAATGHGLFTKMECWNDGIMGLISSSRIIPLFQLFRCSNLISFSAHLLFYDPGEYVSAFGFQHRFGVDTSKDVQQRSDQTCPSRLMAGA